MKEYNFLAFDIGATSGRAVLGTLCDGKFYMREISRFPNPMVEVHGRFYWDVYNLYVSLIESLLLCSREKIELCSMGIDTWGVDFGYVVSDGSLLGLPRAYRDPYTVGVPEEFFKQITKEEVYKRTGIQVMPFNSLFQLYKMARGSFVPQKVADRLLFVPDLLAYLLTGKMVCEYTIASTSQLINPWTQEFDEKLLKSVGMSVSSMAPLVSPGTLIGRLSESVARKTGIGDVPVIAVAEHDTASAVVAVPFTSPGFAYLSSGTWSLMGIEVDKPIINEDSFKNNFTNEGGVEGTIRFLKNITGLWILERCREQWKRMGNDYSYEDLVHMARLSHFPSLINPDDARFANPNDMLQEIILYCQATGQLAPSSDADFVRCVFYSLANRYGEVLGTLASMSPYAIERLHVIGGGSKNDLLNQLTANAIGLPVVAGPSEATAIGNCLVQAKSVGLLADRWAIRELVASSFPLKVFNPEC